MIFLVSLPLWLGLFIWAFQALVTAPWLERRMLDKLTER